MYYSSYKFSNLFGGAYTGGELVFTKDGNSLLSCVGNRVNVSDLVNHTSICLPCESRRNVAHILVDPLRRGETLLLIDDAGHCIVVSLRNRVILHQLQFKAYSRVAAYTLKKGNHSFAAHNVNVVRHASYSPNGIFIAIAVAKKLQIWHRPREELCWQLTPYMEFGDHLDSIEYVDWSSDSECVVTASRDMTARLYSVSRTPKFATTVFVDHRTRLLGSFFSADTKRIYSVSADGAIICWKWMDADASCDNILESTNGAVANAKLFQIGDAGLKSSSEGHGNDRWTVEKKAYYNLQNSSKVSCCAYHKISSRLVICTNVGTFSVYSCPELNACSTLSIGGGSLPVDISTVSLNADGTWIALGAADSGTLIVWEWQSETYILRQQGHRNGIRCTAFCRSSTTCMRIGSHANKEDDAGIMSTFNISGGSTLASGRSTNLRGVLATGGVDGKVKLWDAVSGFCFVTFPQHTAACTELVFTPQGNAVLSSSLDGSVRAFDLIRYRNFKTFVATEGGAVQFMCVGVDSGGELVVAGAQTANEYHVYVWSIQTGRLTEKLSGHVAPISAVAFHPHPKYPGLLTSSSWDKTIRIWDLYGRVDSGEGAQLLHASDVVAIAFDPRGNGRLASATLAGNVTFWDIDLVQVVGSIDGLRDIKSGRVTGDRRCTHTLSSKKLLSDVNVGVNQNHHFGSISYSSTGQWLLAASRNSPRVCIYDTTAYLLLQAVQLTRSLSLDGLSAELNSRYVTETGTAITDFDLSDDEGTAAFGGSRYRKRIKQHDSLPGVMYGELQSECRKRQFNVWQVACSSDGSQWAAATSHGLYTFALDLLGNGNNYGGVASCQLLGSITKNTVSRGLFAPRWLTKLVNIPNIYKSVDRKMYSKALILSLALNDVAVLTEVYHSIPYNKILLVVQSIAAPLIPGLLNLLRFLVHPSRTYDSANSKQSTSAGCSPHLQYHLAWLQALLSIHISNFHGGMVAKSSMEKLDNSSKSSPAIERYSVEPANADTRNLLLLLLQALQDIQTYIAKLYSQNLYSLMYLSHVIKLTERPLTELTN